MKNRKREMAENLETVTHTHTPHRYLYQIKNNYTIDSSAVLFSILKYVEENICTHRLFVYVHFLCT